MNMENANDHPFKVSIVKDADMFANSHPFKVSIEGGGGGGNEGRVVDELPEEGEPGYIYLVLKESTPEGDIYDEYMWVLQQDGETYGWEHIGATNEVNLDVVKTLTEDDYNWNRRTQSATEPYDCVAIWLLDDGLYTGSPNMTICPVQNWSIGSYNGIMMNRKSTGSGVGYGTIVSFSAGGSYIWSGVNGGVAAFEQRLDNPVIEQTTGQDSTRVMSQKAITDAINEVAGVERELSISDYDYFPSPNLGGVDLRDAPVGRYYTNEPNDALVRCYITSVEFVYLRKGENYLEVCETINGIKTYKVRGYDTDGSVSYYDVDVANDTYKFQEYYAKGTVQNNLNSTSTVYALSAYQGKVLNDKIGQIETVLQAITTGNGV